MDTGPLQFYLDCFRYGCTPRAGLGMGLSRLLMAMLGLGSIRDATFLLRGFNRLPPEGGRERFLPDATSAFLLIL